MKISALLFITLLLATTTSAAGIGVAPAELSFSVEKDKTQQRELTVYNLENNEVELDVTSDSPALKFNHSGSIGASGKEKITIEADAKRLKEGSHSSAIYITTKTPASGVRLNLGTAVKADINVFTTVKTNAIIGVMTSSAIVLLGLLTYLASRRLNRAFAAQKA